MFENTRAASVLPVVNTSPLTVRRRWKEMTPACVLLGFLLALVKHGFSVGSCTGRVVSVRNSISRTPWHSLCRCLLGAKLVARGESSAEECLTCSRIPGLPLSSRWLTLRL